MEWINELQHEYVEAPGGVRVEGVVMARGVRTARARIERRRPVAVVVRDQQTVRQLQFPDERPVGAALAVAAPLALYAFVRIGLARRR
jgi:hypothetical protein